MFQINLVPEIKIEQQKINKINTYVTTSAILVATIMGVAIFLLLSLNGYQRVRLSGLDKKIESIETELVAYKDIEDIATSLETGINKIKKIQSEKQNWSSLFENIERVTPSDVRFMSMSIKKEGVISATLEGKKVDSIDKFIKSVSSYKDKNNNNMFSNVIVGSYTIGENGAYRFLAEFNYSKELL